ncbi:Short-chain dehydrogenase/reductase SDR [Trinorchestia longiramus]|nr:Short-chain dehydrogenase/reductase SDR [Trinorchestia longiramus]
MWLEVLLGCVAVAVAVKKILFKWLNGRCYSTNRLDGKLVIITGASAGIGLETTLDMARRGAKVIMACRNLDKAQKVADKIIKETGNEKVIVKKLDLASLASVRAFANDILRTERALHILVNNAGQGGSAQKVITEDGLEQTMQANHFGHFLLTNMLGSLLKAGTPSRIVCVSSVVHLWTPKLDTEDLNFRTMSYSGIAAYGLSKLCNVLMARELSVRLKGTGVTAYSLHPGFVATEIFYKNSPDLPSWFYKLAVNLFSKDVEEGAQTTIYCAVDDAVADQSGLYYSDCKVSFTSKAAKDDELAAKLWSASEAAVKLMPHEANI